MSLTIQFFIDCAGAGFIPGPQEPGLAVCGFYQNKRGTGGVQPQLQAAQLRAGEITLQQGIHAGAEGAVVGLAMYTNVISPWEWDTPWQA